jgi:hypothetical protein
MTSVVEIRQRHYPICRVKAMPRIAPVEIALAYPCTLAQHTCPVCGAYKSFSSLVCNPTRHDLSSSETEQAIQGFERRLATVRNMAF